MSAFIGGELLMGFKEPSIEFLLRHDSNHYRHESMVYAAQLRALAIVGTRFIHLDPGLRDSTWDSITLDPKAWDRKAMHDICARDDEPHDLAGGYDQLVVNIQEAFLVGFEGIGGDHIAVIAE